MSVLFQNTSIKEVPSCLCTVCFFQMCHMNEAACSQYVVKNIIYRYKTFDLAHDGTSTEMCPKVCTVPDNNNYVYNAE